MSCCSCLARTIIGLVNLIILIVIGVVIFVSWGNIKNFNMDEVEGSKKQFIFMIVVFAFIALTCVIGFFMLCCGESKCFRTTYAVFYFIIVVAEIVLVVIVYKNKDKIKDNTQEQFEKHAGEKSVQDIEKAFECCSYNKPYNITMQPKCGYQPENITYENVTEDNTTVEYTTGIPTCKAKIDDELKKYHKSIQIAAIVVLVVQVLVLIYALWYACCYKPHHKRDKSSSSSSS